MNGCGFEGCGSPVIAHGLCTRHYMQQRRGRLGKTRRISVPGTSTTINVAIDRDAKAALFLVARLSKISGSEWVRRLIEEQPAIADRLRQIRAKRSACSR